MRKVFFFGILLTLLTGCYTYITTSNISVDTRNRTFNAGEQAVYDAVLAHFVSAGYQITEANLTSGVITTGYQRSYEERTRLTALIKTISKDNTHVLLALTVEDVDSNGEWSNTYYMQSKVKKLYRNHFREIARQLDALN